MSANTINSTYTIEWCRNWALVTKVFFVNGMWKECYRYSDWLMLPDGITPDDTGWTEWGCPVNTDMDTSWVRAVPWSTPWFVDSFTFTNPMTSVTVHNWTEDIVTIELTVSDSFASNGQAIINPKSSLDISFNNNTILWVEFQSSTTTAWYWFVNALYDR